MTMQAPDGGGARSYVSSDCTRLPGVSTATHFLAPITHNTTRPGPRNLEQQTDPPPFSVLEIMCCVEVPLHTLHFILFFKRCHKQGGE